MENKDQQRIHGTFPRNSWLGDVIRIQDDRHSKRALEGKLKEKMNHDTPWTR
jgi:hypothetical protein